MKPAMARDTIRHLTERSCMWPSLRWDFTLLDTWLRRFVTIHKVHLLKLLVY
jgi:hypothetical protein